MTSRARRIAVLLAMATPIVACSAITDFQGFVGDATSSDAAIKDAADATTADGTGPTNDAGDATDAMTAADTTPPPRFCADASGLVLCDDFDDVDANLKNIWDSVFSGMGSVAVDKSAWVSQPASLLSNGVGGGGGQGLVRKDLAGHTRAAVAADVRLDAFDKVGYGAVLEIHLDPFPDGFSDYRVALIYTSGQMTLDVFAQNQEGGNTQASAPISLDFSQWQRISIELAMNPSPHATAYDRTGAVIATLPMTAFSGSATQTGQYVMVGLTYLLSNNMPWKVRQDNVTILVGD